MSGTGYNVGSFVAVLPILYAVIRRRAAATLRRDGERETAETAWASSLVEATAARHIIRAYDLVDRFTARFRGEYQRYQTNLQRTRYHEQTTDLILRWILTGVLIVLYVFSPNLVEDVAMSVGEFAAITRGWLGLMAGVRGLNESVLRLQRARLALAKVASVLNKKTVYQEQRMVALKYDIAFKPNYPGIQQNNAHSFMRTEQDSMTTNRSLGASAGVGAPGLRSPKIAGRVTMSIEEDLEFIRLENVTFEYASSIYQTGENPPLSHATVVIPTSGELVYLVNYGKSAAKRTLLRLLAGVLHPSSGRITIPPHRRVVLVERKPVILAVPILL
jgi:ABC-type multidrug transport system fused ATPase/permease subunit